MDVHGLSFDEAEVGLVETEYFISGTANSYSASDELGSDGVWTVQPADTAEYVSRIVVQRPADSADFNGTPTNLSRTFNSSSDSWSRMRSYNKATIASLLGKYW